jgi:hypothetical protein
LLKLRLPEAVYISTFSTKEDLAEWEYVHLLALEAKTYRQAAILGLRLYTRSFSSTKNITSFSSIFTAARI